MASPAPTPPFDRADAANDLADKFYSAAEALDDFVNSANPPLPPELAAALEKQSSQLEDQANDFTAEAIGATLQSIQTDLGSIQATTTKAAAQLDKIDDVNKAIAIATAVLNLGTAIVTNPSAATILAASQALAETLVANT